MPYVDLAGLSRFAGKSKDFASSACAGLDMANWQKTSAAGAVSFLPVPEMPLDPVVNFQFTETDPASGTKGPDNPSTIAGVTQAKVTRCGKNLIPYPYPQSSFANHGYTATSNNDGSVTFNGESDGLGACHFNLVPTGTFLVKGGVSYTAALYGAVNTGVVFQAWGSDGRFVFSVWSGGQPATITLNEDAYITMRVTATQTAGSLTNAVFRPQLELGSAATSFEPYEGADYAVNLGGTYYGGSVDLSAGTMTVTHKGMQAVAGSSSAYAVVNGIALCILGCGEAVKNDNTALACTRFPVVSDNTQEGIRCRGSDVFYSILCQINMSRLDFSSAVDPSNPTLAEVQAAFAVWLAANPMDIVFRPVNTQIVSLTPLQIYSLSQIDPYNPRINTVYSDQTSVQVGYPKSPQASAAELTNAIISLGSNL